VPSSSFGISPVICRWGAIGLGVHRRVVAPEERIVGRECLAIEVSFMGNAVYIKDAINTQCSLQGESQDEDVIIK